MIIKISGSLRAAVADIHDGATVIIGGFGNAGMPSALITGHWHTGAKDAIPAVGGAMDRHRRPPGFRDDGTPDWPGRQQDRRAVASPSGHVLDRLAD
jgi:hypothetical protein